MERDESSLMSRYISPVIILLLYTMLCRCLTAELKCLGPSTSKSHNFHPSHVRTDILKVSKYVKVSSNLYKSSAYVYKLYQQVFDSFISVGASAGNNQNPLQRRSVI